MVLRILEILFEIIYDIKLKIVATSFQSEKIYHTLSRRVKNDEIKTTEITGHCRCFQDSFGTEYSNYRSGSFDSIKPTIEIRSFNLFRFRCPKLSMSNTSDILLSQEVTTKMGI